MSKFLQIRKEQYGSRTVYSVSNLTWTVIDRSYYGAVNCSCGADLRTIPFVELQNHDSHEVR